MKYKQQWKPGTPCHNNGVVMCADHSQCFRCGWNPEVSAKRLEAITKALQKKRRAGK